VTDVNDHLHAVIMAGGRGTRFWPLSRSRRPKQLLPIVSERTMIQETAARVRQLVPAERTWVVTAAELADEVAQQLAFLDRDRILIEPVGRNTAPAVGLAAAHLLARDPAAVMAVLPADHAIADEAAFRAALAAAATAAAQHGRLVTLGVTPSRPETGYGYIESGPVATRIAGLSCHEVVAFREKPDLDTAQRYLADGRHAWNAGIFVWRADIIRDEIAAHLPVLAGALADPALVAGGARAAAALAAAYAALEPISIDYGVLERSRRIWMLPIDCGWNDVGSWTALYDVRPRDAAGNAVAGEVVLADARNSVVHAGGPLVALVGVEDLIVISTPDAVLVCARDKAQDVRQVVGELERRGRTDLL
jgi:mannose-1-phosphate guanylyltransferase